MMPFPFPFTVYGANRSSAGGGGGCADGSWVVGTTGSAAVGNITSAYALEFDGVNQYVDVSDCSTDFRGLANFSFACWYWADSYPTTNAASHPVLFSVGSSGDASRINFQFEGHALDWLKRGIILNMFGGSGGNMDTHGYGNHYAWIGNLNLYPLSKPAVTGQWNHMAWSYTGGESTSSEIVQVWINGIKHSTTNANGEWSASNNGNSSISTPAYLPNTLGTTFSKSHISQHDTGVNGYYDGKIDQLAIWNTFITETDVLNLFSGTLAPSALSSSNQIAYWSMDDGAPNATLADESGNDYAGTLTNMDTGSCS
tara:strand:- start:646 stop:1584 length:939 start_codon:yes stop_codon:yes gene_type:complete